jgi:hypothetical protein
MFGWSMPWKDFDRCSSRASKFCLREEVGEAIGPLALRVRNLSRVKELDETHMRLVDGWLVHALLSRYG